LRPYSAFIQVCSVYARSSLVGNTEELEEVIIILRAEFVNSFSNVIQIGSFICGNEDDFTILSDFDDGEIISLNDMDHAGAVIVVAFLFLLL